MGAAEDFTQAANVLFAAVAGAAVGAALGYAVAHLEDADARGLEESRRRAEYDRGMRDGLSRGFRLGEDNIRAVEASRRRVEAQNAPRPQGRGYADGVVDGMGAAAEREREVARRAEQERQRSARRRDTVRGY